MEVRLKELNETPNSTIHCRNFWVQGRNKWPLPVQKFQAWGLSVSPGELCGGWCAETAIKGRMLNHSLPKMSVVGNGKIWACRKQAASIKSSRCPLAKAQDWKSGYSTNSLGVANKTSCKADKAAWDKQTPGPPSLKTKPVRGRSKNCRTPK